MSDSFCVSLFHSFPTKYLKIIGGHFGKDGIEQNDNYLGFELFLFLFFALRVLSV